jgi:hypothetical protein
MIVLGLIWNMRMMPILLMGAVDIYDPTDWPDANFASAQRSDHRRLIPQSQQCSCALCNPRSHEIHLPIDLFQPRFGGACNIDGACGNTTKKPRILTDAGFSQKIFG